MSIFPASHIYLRWISIVLSEAPYIHPWIIPLQIKTVNASSALFRRGVIRINPLSLPWILPLNNSFLTFFLNIRSDDGRASIKLIIVSATAKALLSMSAFLTGSPFPLMAICAGRKTISLSGMGLTQYLCACVLTVTAGDPSDLSDQYTLFA